MALKSALDGENISDSKISDLLETATDILLDEIGRDKLPSRLNSAAVQLAVVIYNRQGAEGESSRSEGGISRIFIDDLPREFSSRLKNYAMYVVFINAADD